MIKDNTDIKYIINELFVYINTTDRDDEIRNVIIPSLIMSSKRPKIRFYYNIKTKTFDTTRSIGVTFLRTVISIDDLNVESFKFYLEKSIEDYYVTVINSNETDINTLINNGTLTYLESFNNMSFINLSMLKDYDQLIIYTLKKQGSNNFINEYIRKLYDYYNFYTKNSSKNEIYSTSSISSYKQLFVNDTNFNIFLELLDIDNCINLYKEIIYDDSDLNMDYYGTSYFYRSTIIKIFVKVCYKSKHFEELDLFINTYLSNLLKLNLSEKLLFQDYFIGDYIYENYTLITNIPNVKTSQVSSYDFKNVILASKNGHIDIFNSPFNNNLFISEKYYNDLITVKNVDKKYRPLNIFDNLNLTNVDILKPIKLDLDYNKQICILKKGCHYD